MKLVDRTVGLLTASACKRLIAVPGNMTACVRAIWRRYHAPPAMQNPQPEVWTFKTGPFECNVSVRLALGSVIATFIPAHSPS